MSKQKTAIVAAVGVLGGMVLGQALPAAHAFQLRDILKGGAVILLVDKFGDEIDRFVNTLTGNKVHNAAEATRVVPILTLGRGTYAGAVQVTGPSDLVDQVKAVAQVEGDTRIGSERVRAKALIPVSTRQVNTLQSLSRVKGVGVSALVDLKL